jgi:hypothetical protein
MVRAQPDQGNASGALAGHSVVRRQRRLGTVLRGYGARRPRLCRLQLTINQPSPTAPGAAARLGRLQRHCVSTRHHRGHPRHEEQPPAQRHGRQRGHRDIFPRVIRALAPPAWPSAAVGDNSPIPRTTQPTSRKPASTCQTMPLPLVPDSAGGRQLYQVRRRETVIWGKPARTGAAARAS